MAQKVYAAAAAASPRPRMLAGPDWSNANMDPKKLKWWMGSVSKHLSMVGVLCAVCVPVRVCRG